MLGAFQCSRARRAYLIKMGREVSIDFSLKRALAAAVQHATDAAPLRKFAVHPLTRMSCDETLFDMTCDVNDRGNVSAAVLIKGAGSESQRLGVVEPLQDVTPFVLNTI